MGKMGSRYRAKMVIKAGNKPLESLEIDGSGWPTFASDQKLASVQKNGLRRRGRFLGGRNSGKNS